MRNATIAGLLLLCSLAAICQNQEPTPPPYCNPCLFYGGDFDPANSQANSIGNMYTSHVPLIETTYVPFYIPAGQVWTILGVFSNNLSTVQYIEPMQMNWSISKGVSTGRAGTIIASGTIPATWTPTGRSYQGNTEYTVLGRFAPGVSVSLASGTYWMTAVPVCTEQTGICVNAGYFISDVEDIPAPNHKGFEPNDRSYFNWARGALTLRPRGAQAASVAAGVTGSPLACLATPRLANNHLALRLFSFC